MVMYAVEGHDGFTAIPDAWALPVPAMTSDEQCAATLEAALAGALGADEGADRASGCVPTGRSGDA